MFFCSPFGVLTPIVIFSLNKYFDAFEFPWLNYQVSSPVRGNESNLRINFNPSPVIELNRAVAVGMHKGPEAGLVIINDLLKKGRLDSYHLVYSAKADFSKKLGLNEDAVKAYKTAIKFARQEPERRYLEKQLSKIIK